MTVILKNTSGRLQTFVLTHETYCKAHGTCCCRTIQGQPPRRIASSLTLPSGTASPELPEAVLALASVKRAVVRGAIAVRRVAAAPPLERSKPPEPRVDGPTVPPTNTVTQSKRKRGSR